MPGTIEWVQDNELTDLQGVGDAERAGDELEEVSTERVAVSLDVPGCVWVCGCMT